MKVNGIKDELKHIEKELRKQAPEVEKVIPFMLKKFRGASDHSGNSQIEEAHATHLQRISQLEDVIFAADDKIFGSFCRKIKVKNIREYEQRQLKVAQEGSEARLRYDQQIARLTHQ